MSNVLLTSRCTWGLLDSLCRSISNITADRIVDVDISASVLSRDACSSKHSIAIVCGPSVHLSVTLMYPDHIS